MSNRISPALIFVIAICAQSQQADKRLTFDAASVKRAIAPDGVTVFGDTFDGATPEQIRKLKRTGGPGTGDPGRIHYPLVSLKQLLELAWEGSYSGIKGPDWLDTQTVAVDATMPPETTKEQFREMLQSLIIDRFKLTYHVADKAGSGYYVLTPNETPKKMGAGVMTIDHMEKTPSAN